TVMADLLPLRPTELRVYGASMGGMVSKMFLDRYRQAGVPFGKITLILDSAPANRNDIKRPSFFLDASCWYRGGLLSSIVWAVVSEFWKKPPVPDGTSRNIVLAARNAEAWVGMPAATSQAC